MPTSSGFGSRWLTKICSSLDQKKKKIRKSGDEIGHGHEDDVTQFDEIDVHQGSCSPHSIRLQFTLRQSKEILIFSYESDSTIGTRSSVRSNKFIPFNGQRDKKQ